MISLQRRLTNHALLIFIAFAISLVRLYQIPSGWSWEPCLWLTLVWWMVLGIAEELIRRRGQLSLGRILFALTLLPCIVLFPFSEIRLSYERAAVKADVDRPIDRTTMGWVGMLGWQQFWDDQLIPNCLIWRVCENGSDLLTHVNTDQLMRGRLSRTVTNEIENLDVLSVSTIDTFPTVDQARVLGENLRRISKLKRLRFEGSFKDDAIAEAIRQLGEQQCLTYMSVEGTGKIAPRLFERVLCSHNLNAIALKNPEIDDEAIGIANLLGKSISTHFDRTKIGANKIESLIDHDNTLKYLAIRYDQVKFDWIKKLRPDPMGMKLEVICEDSLLPDDFLESMMNALDASFTVIATKTRPCVTISYGHFTELPNLKRQCRWDISFYDTKLELLAARQLMMQPYPNFEYVSFQIRFRDIEAFLECVRDPQTLARFEKRIKDQLPKEKNKPTPEWMTLFTENPGMF